MFVIIFTVYYSVTVLLLVYLVLIVTFCILLGIVYRFVFIVTGTE